MRQKGNKLRAGENRVLRCRIDGVVYGKEVVMGKTFYRDGEYVAEGIETRAEDYEEIWGFELDGQEVATDAEGYEAMVAALIRTRYSLDAELALAANVRTDAGKYAAEEAAFQAWRELCKAKAREIFSLSPALP